MIRILKESETKREAIFAREDPVGSVEEPVRAIIAQIRAKGDEALKRYTKEFDGVDITSVEVGQGAIDEGFRMADPMLVDILYRASERVAAFHQHQVRNSFLVNEEDGILMGQKIIPLERVGLYVPGGTAAYPSSVIMNCIPAKLAGVKEIVMVTPPGKDGKIPPNILAAARICGVNRVFRVGGAQAIAALAYGTESVPRVDKIVGPGNQFVAEAKKQVFGKVGIDMVAGRIVAADLLSQAEHDKERLRRPCHRQRGAGRGRSGRHRGAAAQAPSGGNCPRLHRHQRQDHRGRQPGHRRGDRQRDRPGAPGGLRGPAL